MMIPNWDLQVMLAVIRDLILSTMDWIETDCWLNTMLFLANQIWFHINQILKTYTLIDMVLSLSTRIQVAHQPVDPRRFINE